jgi:hypothetical protein
LRSPNTVVSQVTVPIAPPPDPAAVAFMQQNLGALNWLFVATRPDIGFALARLRPYTNCPTAVHFRALQQIWKYLAGTRDLGPTYLSHRHPAAPSSFHAQAFVDASWAENVPRRRSHYGWLLYLAGGVVSWASTSLATVALSSCEAEIRALSELAKNGVAMHRLLCDLCAKLPGWVQRPIAIQCDNQGAISNAFDAKGFLRAMKHIEVRYYFLSDLIAEQIITVSFVPSVSNPADLLTKPLNAVLFERCRALLFGAYVVG